MAADAGRDLAPIALVVSDVDGTLVDDDKTLSPAAIEAVRTLRAAGARFSLISSRPPRGMAAVAKALDVSEPMAAFNGGTLFGPDGRLIETHRLEAGAARTAISALEDAGVETWVYADATWRLKDSEGLRVDHERRAIGFGPKVVAGFDDVLGRIDKIVGVSDDHPLLSRLGEEIGEMLGDRAEVEQSQAYYLDVTHPRACKGDGVRAICARLGIDPQNTAVIGDMFNDVSMFQVAGLSVAMGQSPAPVKAMADAVSPAGNDDDGFARAVTEILLPRIRRAAA